MEADKSLELAIEEIKARIPDAWGKYISCDKGWYQLIVELDKDLTYLIPGYEVQQIKQKFGTLRYYIGYDDQKSSQEKILIARKLIEYAEYKSSITCECCGTSSLDVRARVGGWVKTLCNSCDEKRERQI